MAGRLLKRGRYWYGRVRVDGREHERSLRTGDRAEARRRLDAYAAEVAGIRYVGGARVTYEMAVARWVAEVVPDLKPPTAKRYVSSSARLFSAFGKLHLDEVGKAAIKEFIRARRAEGVTNATVRRDLTALSSIMESAEDEGWLDANPVRLVGTRKLKERRPPIDPPGREAIEAVLRHAAPGFAALVRFCAETGCRQEEAAAMEVRDLDLDAGTATFRRAKRDLVRTVRLRSPGGDAHAVAASRGAAGGAVRLLPSAPLFGPRPGERYKNVSSNFVQLCRRVAALEAAEGRAFRPFRFHDLRHAFAKRWLQAGGGIYDLKTHLGHRSVRTTEVYLRFVAHVPGDNGGADSSGSQAVEMRPGRG